MRPFAGIVLWDCLPPGGKVFAAVVMVGVPAGLDALAASGPSKVGEHRSSIARGRRSHCVALVRQFGISAALAV